VDKEIVERLARLETQMEDIADIKKTIKELQDKLNGYLEHRVKNIVKAMLGEILITVVSSSAVVSLLISLLFGR